MPDGEVLVYPRNYNWQKHPMELHYIEEGENAYLVLAERDATRRFAGRASHQKFALTFFTSSFSPEIQKQIIQVQNGEEWGIRGVVRNPVIVGGEIVVRDVSQLKLGDLPTVATGSFAWEARLNPIGQVLAQSGDHSGTGWALFRQKPDRSWLVEQWCIQCN
jgi:hypothetical protein